MKGGNAQLGHGTGVGAAQATAYYSESVVQSGVRWSRPYNSDFEDGNDFGLVTLVGWETAARM